MDEDTLDLTETQDQVKKIIDSYDEERMQLRLIEVAYIKSKGLDVSAPEADDLFPMGWFEDSDFMKKINIVAEAITTNKTIQETNAYRELSEGKRM